MREACHQRGDAATRVQRASTRHPGAWLGVFVDMAGNKIATMFSTSFCGELFSGRVQTVVETVVIMTSFGGSANRTT